MLLLDVYKTQVTDAPVTYLDAFRAPTFNRASLQTSIEETRVAIKRMHVTQKLYCEKENV